jgi:hypothetical protein
MKRLAATLALTFALALPAAADQRSYAFTYQPITAPRGGIDLELYSTLADPPGDAAGGRLWRHQVEVEYGITDRWDVSLYNVFRRPHGGELEYEAFKVRTRYRLADPGAWPVDVVAYLEVAQSVVDERPTKLEEKLIVGKDLGRANLTANLVAEQEFEDGTAALEWGWGGGASWEFAPSLRLGAEAFGALKEVETATGGELEAEAWAGPAISVSLPVAAGALHGSWLAVTAGFGLTPDSDDLRLRGILAFQF